MSARNTIGTVASVLCEDDVQHQIVSRYFHHRFETALSLPLFTYRKKKMLLKKLSNDFDYWSRVGYITSWFVDPLSGHFDCPVCLEVLKDSVICPSGGCQKPKFVFIWMTSLLTSRPCFLPDLCGTLRPQGV